MQAEDTIFHQIIRREIPANIVFEDESCIAFRDINPAANCHLLIVPKKTMPSLREAEAEDELLLGHLLHVAATIAKKEGISKDGYRVVLNVGPDGQQTVYQLHVHLLGGRPFSWPPG